MLNFLDSRKKPLRLVASILALLAATSAAGADQKPNVIVVLADDLGYQDVSFNGSPDISTPNIDRIASEGAKFSNAYVTYAVCGPSRAGLLTGRYQDRFGYSRNPVIDPKDPDAGLPLSEQMISEVLEPVGYTSGIIGKWHMGMHPKYHPNKRGFDYFYGFLSGGHFYQPEDLIYESLDEAMQHDAWFKTKIMENGGRVETDDYLTDELTKAGIGFIEREQDNPFFLYMSYNAPHTPLQATEEYLARNEHIEDEDRRTYAAMVTALDDGVGRILDTLKELDIDENTLIFFLSDNGGTKQGFASNAPFRGFKSELFEGGVRVPFAMRWPGVIPAGTTYDELVSSLDILSTAASITNAPIAKERPLDGVNLIPYLAGNKLGAPHDQLFWRKYDDQEVGMRKGQKKYIFDQRLGERHLYQLDSDTAEQHNLIEDEADAFGQGLIEMADWNKEMQDPVFRGLMWKQYSKSSGKLDLQSEKALPVANDGGS